MARAQTSTPISLTGFNQDIIIGASETDTTFTVSVSGWNYYETGLAGTTQGLPVSRTFLSAADSSIQFQLASYDHTNNALVLGNGVSADLTLASATRFQDIHFLVAKQGGGTANSENVTLHFTNASTTAIPSFTGLPDWTVSPGTIALADMGLIPFRIQKYGFVGAQLAAPSRADQGPPLQVLIRLSAKWYERIERLQQHPLLRPV